MNRRNLIAGGAALAGAAIAPSISVAEVETETLEDKYWRAQRLIDELHEELDEMRAHAKIMKKHL